MALQMGEPVVRLVAGGGDPSERRSGLARGGLGGGRCRTGGGESDLFGPPQVGLARTQSIPGGMKRLVSRRDLCRRPPQIGLGGAHFPQGRAQRCVERFVAVGADGLVEFGPPGGEVRLRRVVSMLGCLHLGVGLSHLRCDLAALGAGGIVGVGEVVRRSRDTQRPIGERDSLARGRLVRARTAHRLVERGCLDPGAAQVGLGGPQRVEGGVGHLSVEALSEYPLLSPQGVRLRSRPPSGVLHTPEVEQPDEDRSPLRGLAAQELREVTLGQHHRAGERREVEPGDLLDVGAHLVGPVGDGSGGVSIHLFQERVVLAATRRLQAQPP